MLVIAVKSKSSMTMRRRLLVGDGRLSVLCYQELVLRTRETRLPVSAVERVTQEAAWCTTVVAAALVTSATTKQQY